MQQMIYSIRLDLRDTGIVNTSLRLKQGDSGIKIVVNVFNGGVAVFDSSTTPKIVFRRPDGAAVMADMTVDASSYSYTLVGNELQVPGKELIDVKFPLGDTGRESTLSCSIEVVPDTITPNTHGSDIYDNDLAELVAEATAAAETVEEVVGDSEAWAVGERNGVPVGPEDPAYHNNSKWWSEQANVTSLAALTDVDLDTLENGDLLQFNSTTSKWKNSSDVWATMTQNGAHNLLRYPYTDGASKTYGGVTFSASSDGTLTFSSTGNPSSNAFYYFAGTSDKIHLKKGKYILSGCNGGNGSNYYIQGFGTVDYTSGAGILCTDEDGVEFTLTADNDIYIFVSVRTGWTGGTATIEPMIRVATDADTTRMPYAMTNRELTEKQIKVKEVDISSLAVTTASGAIYYAVVNPQLPSDSKILSVNWGGEGSWNGGIWFIANDKNNVILVQSTTSQTLGTGKKINVYYI